MKEPTCSSLTCIFWGCNSCKKCYHYISYGEWPDENGKVWRWEMTYFGPQFIGKSGEPFKKQPISPGHAAWRAYTDWEINGYTEALGTIIDKCGEDYDGRDTVEGFKELVKTIVILAKLGLNHEPIWVDTEKEPIKCPR